MAPETHVSSDWPMVTTCKFYRYLKEMSGIKPASRSDPKINSNRFKTDLYITIL